jgi:hypothetical protein
MCRTHALAVFHQFISILQKMSFSNSPLAYAATQVIEGAKVAGAVRIIGIDRHNKKFKQGAPLSIS